jgi:hypothetical protein
VTRWWRGPLGGSIGLLLSTVAAYLLAILAGSPGPWLVLIPVGVVIGWAAGRRWGTVRQCPQCRGEVSAAANVCRHCGSTLKPLSDDLARLRHL